MRTVIRDEELADGIMESIDQGKSDIERISRVRMLMTERLCQCKKAASNKG